MTQIRTVSKPDKADQGKTEQSLDELRSVIDRAVQAEREVAFMHRIMVQAILTHGGKMVVDPSKYHDAMHGNYTIEFQSDGVVIHGSPESLWPNLNK